MNVRRQFAAIFFAGLTLGVLIPASASAYESSPLTFCNKTAETVDFAYGYFSPGLNDPADHSALTGPFVSLGWWWVEPGACETVPNPFGARYLFWFAASKTFNITAAEIAPMRDPSLPDHFCINPGKKFTFEDENASVDACDRALGKWINPHKVDTWVNGTVDFNR